MPVQLAVPVLRQAGIVLQPGGPFLQSAVPVLQLAGPDLQPAVPVLQPLNYEGVLHQKSADSKKVFE